jgi:hypothetical protein
VDDLNAGVDSKCRWLQSLIPGELKNNLLAGKASRAWLDLGRYAREVLAAQDSCRFVLGFTLCGSLSGYGHSIDLGALPLSSSISMKMDFSLCLQCSDFFG